MDVYYYTLFICIALAFISFAGSRTRIWIVGSSIVKWAFVRARCLYDGPHLDLQRQGASVWWQGRGGLRWCHMRRTFRTLLTFEDAPDLLVLHVGGNDLGLVKLGDLRYSISYIVGQLRLLLPSTRFVYSQILPRLIWRNETKHFAVEQARRRINSFVAYWWCIYKISRYL